MRDNGCNYDGVRSVLEAGQQDLPEKAVLDGTTSTQEDQKEGILRERIREKKETKREELCRERRDPSPKKGIIL